LGVRRDGVIQIKLQTQQDGGNERKDPDINGDQHPHLFLDGEDDTQENGEDHVPGRHGRGQ